MDLNEALEQAEEYGALKLDGFDDCIIGLISRCTQGPIILYDVRMILQKLMADGITLEEATEYYETNMLQAWVGDGTPFFFTPLEGKEKGQPDELPPTHGGAYNTVLVKDLLGNEIPQR